MNDRRYLLPWAEEKLTDGRPMWRRYDFGKPRLSPITLWRSIDGIHVVSNSVIGRFLDLNEALAEADMKLKEVGYEFLTQEQWDKLVVLA